ncbi:glucokinase [Sphingomonas sp. MMS24-J13]|uniref:glucokinase n=1 Tax=Sphingomonas sp. MMS24-J13 TaxID=3238686 RepID=UPI003850EDAB
MHIVTIDIGGTNVRFADAVVEGGGVRSLGESVTFKTGAFPSLERAWQAYGETLGHPLPKGVAISFAGPVHGDVLKLTNNPWVIRPALVKQALGVERITLINDFAAVGHTVAHVSPEHLCHICGPDLPLPERGTISIVGPGTGLGVAHVLRQEGGTYHVSETEGGHVDFAPLDALEDKIALSLRHRFGRVSAERVVSGPGLNNLYEILVEGEGNPRRRYHDDELWIAALAGDDSVAMAALDRFCLSLGAVAGDIALAQGGAAVVIAGGIGFRLAHRLAASGFPFRFAAKGRFQTFMEQLPVKALIHPQPGLLGAAAAFAIEHRD